MSLFQEISPFFRETVSTFPILDQIKCLFQVLNQPLLVCVNLVHDRHSLFSSTFNMGGPGKFLKNAKVIAEYFSLIRWELRGIYIYCWGSKGLLRLFFMGLHPTVPAMLLLLCYCYLILIWLYFDIFFCLRTYLQRPLFKV